MNIECKVVQKWRSGRITKDSGLYRDWIRGFSLYDIFKEVIQIPITVKPRLHECDLKCAFKANPANPHSIQIECVHTRRALLITLRSNTKMKRILNVQLRENNVKMAACMLCVKYEVKNCCGKQGKFCTLLSLLYLEQERHLKAYERSSDGWPALLSLLLHYCCHAVTFS